MTIKLMSITPVIGQYSKSQAGFTLIELIMVAIIISILSAIAIPAYQTYIVSAKISEALTVTSTARNLVNEYYRYTGSFPVDNFASGLPSAELITGKYIQSVSVDNGAIHVFLADEQPFLLSGTITLRPVYTEGDPTAPIHFVCGYAEPKNSSHRVVGENKTSIEAHWLPSTCRK